MKRLALVLVCFLLIGCASFGDFLEEVAKSDEEKFEEVLNSWVGASEDVLLLQRGLPESTYEVSGLKVYEYYRESGAPGAWNRWCKVGYIIDSEGIIGTWRYEGNGCY